ncbi:MAG TPA: hypothetical protein VGR25_03835 [bacterium]|jgi:hypothetical protein|nr:hypothetical protein [bacterium]
MQPFDLEGIGRVEHDAGAVQRGLHPPEQFAGTLAITRAKARAAWLRYVICHLGRIVVVAGFGALGKVALGCVSVAAVQLDMANVVQLYRDSPPMSTGLMRAHLLRSEASAGALLRERNEEPTHCCTSAALSVGARR